MKTILVLALSLPAFASDLKVGAAAVKITPQPGVPISGGYTFRISDGMLDDLHAKALVLDGNGSRIALVSCDLIAVTDNVVREARRQILDSTGIPPERVMIGATHTHSGPIFREIIGPGLRDATLGGKAEQHAHWVESLPGSIAESVKQAVGKLVPARVWAAKGRESSLVFNRRFVMRDGPVGWNPGKLNPAIVRPAGPVDPEVAVIYFDSPDGAPLATYVNYPLHVAVTGGFKFSSDYPGALARILADAKGSAMLTMFTLGTAGNINHLNVKNKERQSGPMEAARIGAILAAEVLKSYDRTEAVLAGNLTAASQRLDLPLAPLEADAVARAEATLKLADGPKRPGVQAMANAVKVMHVASLVGKPLSAEVQAMAIGDQVAFVALPGEIFVELGLAIKAASPFPYTIVASLANGWIGYVPDRKAFSEGNYEPLSARCAAGCGEKLVEAATGLLIQLHESARP